MARGFFRRVLRRLLVLFVDDSGIVGFDFPPHLSKALPHNRPDILEACVGEKIDGRRALHFGSERGVESDRAVVARRVHAQGDQNHADGASPVLGRDIEHVQDRDRVDAKRLVQRVRDHADDRVVLARHQMRARALRNDALQPRLGLAD